jgi:hypothetical protein
MGDIALGISILAAMTFAIVYAIVRSVLFWRDRSTARRLSCWTSVLSIPLLFPSLWLVGNLERLGLRVPRPGLPDPASGEAVMTVLISVVTAYLFAFAIVRAVHHLS